MKRVLSTLAGVGLLVGGLACEPENTARYACVERDCQATCEALGRPAGEDESHPFGQCVEDRCECEAPDTTPHEWSDPVPSDTLTEETDSDSSTNGTTDS